MSHCCPSKAPEKSVVLSLLVKAAIAAIGGVIVILDAVFHWLPTLVPHHMSIAWLIVGVVVLVLMGFCGGRIYKGLWFTLLARSATMDTLVGLGTGMAWLYSMVVILAPGIVPEVARHLYFDTALLLLAFINFGGALEARAQKKTSQAIESLIQLQPKKAHVIRDGKEVVLAVADIVVGDWVRVRPGEQVPVDGIITEGESQIDESMITGESLPVSKKTDANVIGGTINKSGSFIFKAERVGANTMLSHIISMVEQAQNTKPAISRLADRISSYFVPSIMIIAIITALIWFNWGPRPQWSYMLLTAVAVLVIACPCALGLATPISVVVGVGKAAENGVLIRDGQSLQQMQSVNAILFDKTGTLTQGQPSLNEIVTVNHVDKKEALRKAASIEALSEHPLAQAVVKAAKDQSIALEKVSQFEAITGQGVRADIAGKTVWLGSDRLMQAKSVAIDEVKSAMSVALQQGKTTLFIAEENTLLAMMTISDSLKSEAKDVIATLQKQQIKTIMVTGDQEKTAVAIAKQCGIDEVRAGVLPDQKAEVVASFQAQGMKVAMVGDGINDAPALASADVGIAIGGGTDIAMESADMVLMSQSLQGVNVAQTISKMTMRNIKQNLVGAFLYNIIGVFIAAGVLYPFTGWLLNPVFAGIAMALSSLTVVSNANRLRWLTLKTAAISQ